jgi:hypothetical protein
MVNEYIGIAELRAIQDNMRVNSSKIIKAIGLENYRRELKEIQDDILELNK